MKYNLRSQTNGSTPSSAEVLETKKISRKRKNVDHSMETIAVTAKKPVIPAKAKQSTSFVADVTSNQTTSAVEIKRGSWTILRATRSTSADFKDEELERLSKLTSLEKKERSQGRLFIAGVDEAGRGPLAGPVVAAACIIPENFLVEGVNDSKKLTHEERRDIFLKIKEHPSVLIGIGIVEHDVIDKINILQATFLAMRKAVEGLLKGPDIVLVDGPYRIPDLEYSGETVECIPVVKGDSKSLSIGLASIVAKETRDDIMDKFHQKYPMYGFDKHKGYPTRDHVAAIQLHGPCEIHRMTFAPLKPKTVKKKK
mmetsp:Transcript_12280/g.19823  ORF Transcript_12280/g.19823 Transcript_12280/m.19823 type:complete len:312 (-) Transcript_12280:307-1242(-)|eukprot:CAMPEP_0184662844 /NCGR_PEP_ID=MMETSP0308-20130426/45178_1 /TAXON_ID=38269 /ORGANISM="Gloeochaete witrockiana, Strain SAG 46.84" /LENGTH=311 /DNA_ID=CAMNT_0027105135 /DNA_START=219 /DNA_END=1154 /DNA_ORIENTATION=+